jgi:outer membrane immunogenic protein
MKTLVHFLTALFSCAILTLSSFGGPEPIRDYKDSKAVVPVPQPCSWQGFYIGANAGGTFGSSEVTDVDGYNFLPGQHWSYDASGFVGGAEAGYNWQPLKWLVLGFEGDLGYLGLDGDGSPPVSPGGNIIGETSDGFYTTLRGRVGLAFDHIMLYATGGVIGADNEVAVVDRGGLVGEGSGSSDDFRFGWTAGGGVAYAFTCHWSAKVEYLYYNLESQDITFHDVEDGNFRFPTKTDGHIVRAGLDFKF